MGMNFIILVGIVSALWVGFLVVIRNIQFPFPEEEDSVTMVNAAATFDHWRWPSAMHRPGFRATYMKDVSILLIAVFQKIFRDKKSPYPMVAMQGFTNVISALLIYLIGSNYWNPTIGLFISLLFIVSYWPWQTATSMGHINVATMIILLSIYATTFVSGGTLTISSPWIIIAGIFIGCLLFCSSSSLKYIFLFFSALIFAKYRTLLEDNQFSELSTTVVNFFNNHYVFNDIISLGLILWLILSRVFYKRLVMAMYHDRLPGLLKKILALMKREMAGKQTFSQEHYIDYAGSKLKQYNIWIVWICVLFLLLINLIGYELLILTVFGFLLVLLLLTLPDIKKNLSFYWLYLKETQIRKKATFRHWVGYFAKKGVIVDRYYRSGLKLVPKLLMRRIPFYMMMFYASIVCLVLVGLIEKQYSLLVITFVMLIVSLSPIIWAELTRCHQNARVYFPVLISILLFIGFALSQIYQSNKFLALNFWSIGLPFLGIIFIWNFWKFFNDAFPARMTILNLIRTLRNNNIREFYTYRTDYNCALIGSINPAILGHYKIHYIDKLSEVKDGWIVIPGTSNKTSLWTTKEMEEGIDFIKDPLLNELLRTKKIEEIATAKFKTFGTSPIWMMDNDINNHRDLIFHEITEEDYFRGYAWLLHTSKLKHLGEIRC